MSRVEMPLPQRDGLLQRSEETLDGEIMRMGEKQKRKAAHHEGSAVQDL